MSHTLVLAAAMCSSHLSSQKAPYYSPVSRDAKLSLELYFMSSQYQKRYMRYLEFVARNNSRIFIFVLFILCNATANDERYQLDATIMIYYHKYL